MPRTKISEYSTTNSDNTDIESINIAEGCAPSGINNAIRELMVHLKEFQTGSSGDPLTVGGTFVASGSATLNGTSIPSSKTLVDTNSSQTLTNKRVTLRVSTTTSSATPTINTDNVDIYGLTAQAANITSFTTNLSGTPVDGQLLWIYIVGTAARTITWGASFESSTITLPTTTVSTDRLDVGFIWNAATSKWRCVAVA